MENKRRTGTLCVFLAAVLYSIGGLCIKLIPWGGMAINGARTAIALVVIGAYLAVIRHPLRFNRWVAVGALSIFGTNALFSVANKLTTAANVIVLQFTAPIFVILFSALFWRRKPGRLDLLACGIVFGGVLFFFADSLEMGGGLGNVLALLSGVAYAGVFLMNEMPDSDAISSVFWGDVLSAVTGLPFLLGEEKLEPIEGNPPDLANLTGGCNFHERCPYCQPICMEKKPELVEFESGHQVACHFTGQLKAPDFGGVSK